MTTPYTSMPVSLVSIPMENPVLAALLAGTKWGAGLAGPVSVAISFPAATSAWFVGQDGHYSSADEPLYLAGQLPPASQHAFRAAALQALSYWSAVSGLRFSELLETSSQVGDLRFALTTTPAIAGWWGWAYAPAAGWAPGGDVWVNPSAISEDWSPGSADALALLHEIGHALGLKHPFESGAVLPAASDSTRYTVMSYTRPADYFLGFDGAGNPHYLSPLTPMLYDIVAIQHLYGINAGYRRSDDYYTFSPDQPFAMTLWDAGGNDTVSAEGFVAACTLDLRAGHFSSLRVSAGSTFYGLESGGEAVYDGSRNLAIAFGTLIENAVGGDGNDRLLGNALSNVLQGGKGNDFLDGGSGQDTVSYADAGAAVRVSLALAVAQNTGSGGNDTLRNIENLLGSGFSDLLLGNAMANRLYGGAGADTLLGGRGNDFLDGGGGQDTASYADAVAAVRVSLGLASAQITGGGGCDTLRAIENLVGSNFADQIFGNALANRLDGGLGADTLSGGAGNDVYVIDHLGDVVQEVAGGGRDTMLSRLSASVLAPNVENAGIVHDGFAALFGNALNNVLYSGGGDSVLVGGLGVDTASYRNADHAVEVSLAKFGPQATGGSGRDALGGIENLTGSSFADRLFGDTAINVLNGGLGNDTLHGGDGRDRFCFDAALRSDNVDRILDFTPGVDVIELKGRVFDQLGGAGKLLSESYRVNKLGQAMDVSDRILYAIESGRLYYDADGSGDEGARLFAILGRGAAHAPDAADFLIS